MKYWDERGKPIIEEVTKLIDLPKKKKKTKKAKRKSKKSKKDEE